MDVDADETHGAWGHKWAAVVCAATIVLAVGAPLIGRGIFLGTDILRTYEPWSADAPSTFVYRHGAIFDTVNSLTPERALLRDSIVNGHFALWDPYPNGGTPLGSTPGLGLISPLNWPLLVLGVRLGSAWSAVLRLALAAWATFAFLRRLGVSRVAAVCGGLIYCTSGFIVAWNNWPQANIAAWIPALFLAFDLLLERKRARDVALLAVVIASMVLEGYPPVLVITAYVLVPFLIVRWWELSPRGSADGLAVRDRVRERLRAAIRPMQLLVGATILGAAIAAFQLVPFLIWGSGFDLSYRQNFRHTALPAAALLTSIVPWALGTSTQPAHDFSLTNFVDTFSFLGAAACVFVVVALIRGAPARVGRGVFRYCVAGAGLLLLAAYASYTLPASPLGGIRIGAPVKAMLYVLPGMSQVPISRLRAPFLFLCALVAAFGVEHVVALPRAAVSGRTRGWWIRRGVVAALGAYVAALAFADEHDQTARLRQLSWVLRQSLGPMLIALVAVVIAVGSKRWGPRLRSSAIVAIPVLLAVEALMVTTPWFPRVASATFYPQSGSLQYLAQQLGHQRFAAGGPMGLQSATTYYRLRSVTGHSFMPATWRDLVVSTSPGNLSGLTLSSLGDSESVATSPILDALAARFFVSSPETEPFGIKVAGSSPVRSAEFGAGASAEGTIASGPLRAVEVALVGPTRLRGSLDYLDVTVRDSGGGVVASGTRRLLQQAATQRYWVSIPGESLPTSGALLRIEVSIRSSVGDTARIATTRTGQVDLGVIRPNGDGLRLVYADAGAVVYQRLRALPRVRWASRSVVVKNSAVRVTDLGSGAVPADTVLLDHSTPPISGKDATVDIVDDSSDKLRVDVDASGTGYLVVADSIQSGWVARIDGKTVPIVRADHALGALRVDAGHHVVELSVAPQGWRAGEAITVVGVLALALVLVVPPLRRRRLRPRAEVTSDPAQ